MENKMAPIKKVVSLAGLHHSTSAFQPAVANMSQTKPFRTIKQCHFQPYFSAVCNNCAILFLFSILYLTSPFYSQWLGWLCVSAHFSVSCSRSPVTVQAMDMLNAILESYPKSKRQLMVSLSLFPPQSLLVVGLFSFSDSIGFEVTWRSHLKENCLSSNDGCHDEIGNQRFSFFFFLFIK